MSFTPLLQAGGSGSLLMTIIPFGLVFVIFYFFIIRPQNRKQKETEKMISALKKGDKVVTIGGIHGVVSSTKDQSVVVKVDDNAKIEFSRSAISSVITDKTEKTDAKTGKIEKADKNVTAEEKTEAETETEPAAEEKK